MIKVEKVSVMNIENAIRGARNPLNSWDRIDSHKCDLGKTDLCIGCPDIKTDCYVVGEKDLDLLVRLCNAGPDHRKFMRQILVSMDITAPLYWWKEFDTYKVGTVANSTSTMHKIHASEFTVDDFSVDKMDIETLSIMDAVINKLNSLRDSYNDTKDKKAWYSMIQLLPTSYNQLRTVTLNYEVLRNIYNSRHNHKLAEWHVMCDILKGMPHSKLIVGDESEMDRRRK